MGGWVHGYICTVTWQGVGQGKLCTKCTLRGPHSALLACGMKSALRCSVSLLAEPEIPPPPNTQTHHHHTRAHTHPPTPTDTPPAGYGGERELRNSPALPSRAGSPAPAPRPSAAPGPRRCCCRSLEAPRSSRRSWTGTPPARSPRSPAVQQRRSCDNYELTMIDNTPPARSPRSPAAEPST